MMGQGQDRLLGRIVAMLDIMSEQFAVLPPHFTIDIEAQGDDEVRTLVLDAVKSVFPGLHGKDECMPGVLQRLLASLVWHAKDDESYLEQLPPDHPLRVSPLYTEGWIAKLKPHVVTGLFKCEKSGMVASGLPPHCAIMLRLVKLEMKIDTLIGDGTDSLRAQLKEDLKASIEQFCEQQGNISQATLQAALASAMDGLRGQLMAALHPDGVPEEPVEEAPPPEDTSPKWHSWADKPGQLARSHRLPQDHVLPKGVNVSLFWNLWFRGAPAERRFPYRECRADDFYVPPKPAAGAAEEVVVEYRRRKNQRKRFTTLVKVFRPMEALVEGEDYFFEKPTPEQSQKMYVEAKKSLGSLLPEGQHVDNAGKYTRRFDQLSCGTLYNSFSKRRKLDKEAQQAAGGH